MLLLRSVTYLHSVITIKEGVGADLKLFEVHLPLYNKAQVFAALQKDQLRGLASFGGMEDIMEDTTSLKEEFSLLLSDPGNFYRNVIAKSGEEMLARANELKKA